MKTIKASLLLPLLTFLFSLALSGCYTQLAFVDDEQYSAVEPSPIIIIHPIIIPVEPIRPIIDPIRPIGLWPINPPSPSVVDPLPKAGSSPIVNVPHSTSPNRESGYQRASRTENTQTTISVSETRTSGSTRGRR